ncbi:MAG: hypothetical protein AAFO62_13435, partial [Pseudomonadota bacterium]
SALRQRGLATYQSIADLSAEDADALDRELGLGGRMERENWVEQARLLAAGGSTAYAAAREMGDTSLAIPAVAPEAPPPEPPPAPAPAPAPEPPPASVPSPPPPIAAEPEPTATNVTDAGLAAGLAAAVGGAATGAVLSNDEPAPPQPDDTEDRRLAALAAARSVVELPGTPEPPRAVRETERDEAIVEPRVVSRDRVAGSWDETDAHASDAGSAAAAAASSVPVSAEPEQPPAVEPAPEPELAPEPEPEPSPVSALSQIET